MDTAALIRVAKAQVKNATTSLGPPGLIELYLDEIPVQISRRGKPGRAGRAGFFHGLGPGDVGRIVINVGVCYTEERFMKTLYHELAHAVNAWIHGKNVDTHGPLWKAVMERLGQPPERCHHYHDRI